MDRRPSGRGTAARRYGPRSLCARQIRGSSPIIGTSRAPATSSARSPPLRRPTRAARARARRRSRRCLPADPRSSPRRRPARMQAPRTPAPASGSAAINVWAAPALRSACGVPHDRQLQTRRTDRRAAPRCRSRGLRSPAADPTGCARSTATLPSARISSTKAWTSACLASSFLARGFVWVRVSNQTKEKTCPVRRRSLLRRSCRSC